MTAPYPLSFYTSCLRLQSAISRSKSTRPNQSYIQHWKRHRSRFLHTGSPILTAHPPKSRDRGPPSQEDTQTDFSALNVLANTPPPTTGIDACTHDGFVLSNDVRIAGSGVLLVGGEAFRWRPWIAGRTDKEEGSGENGKGKITFGGSSRDSRGRWETHGSAWGVLDLVWPKPDILILGTGRSIQPPSALIRQILHDLGIRLEVQDTRNAAAQFNLLATERGLTQVAAALMPVGWGG